ncbi:2-dehydropantoate 2-reductase [Bacillus sp. JCM 19034]|uniref:2-dehydropantoate 2-reductase n=1 Tax=Bacillus sp. JCM 19034 TaxID=1481928 RepID=UPI00078501E3|nr:2-dehydropantoate 2-reductase [Bacillus sp. JCM 19034]
MKVAVIGSGAIGMLISYYLKKNSQDVTLVVRRNEQLKQLQDQFLHMVYSDGETDKVKVKTCLFNDFIESIETFDVVIITVKAYDWPLINKELTKKRFSMKAILFLQNGMQHIQDLSHYIHTEVAVGVVEHGAKRINDYSVAHTGLGSIKWGYNQLGEQSLIRTSVSNIPLLQFEEVDDWYKVILEKMVVNICINPLTALFQVKNGELLNNDFIHSIMKKLFKEVIDVFELSNEDELWNYVCRICKRTKQNVSSMLADIQNGRKTEIEAIVGNVLKVGKEKGMKIENVEMMFQAIKAIEWQKGVR